jgi:hypothetical protein
VEPKGVRRNSDRRKGVQPGAMDTTTTGYCNRTSENLLPGTSVNRPFGFASHGDDYFFFNQDNPGNLNESGGSSRALARRTL